MKDTILEARLHIFLFHTLADIEASLARTAVAFLTNVLTGFLVLLASFHTAFGGDGYIAVAKVDGDLIFLKSGQIHIEFIAVFILSDIGLHQILFPFPEDRALESIFHKVVK